jgi:hypothetical protein
MSSRTLELSLHASDLLESASALDDELLEQLLGSRA